MQHLLPNTTLQGGKYRIERALGQGGFGITYLAEQTSLQRQVAIKEFFMKDLCSRDEATLTMLSPSSGGCRQVEQYKKKFIKEARNLARLNHPNIISVIDVFEENDTVYYVMPYLNGGSLQDYVKAHGTLSEDVAMKYIKQIAGALKYMHEEQHICHFDVKPANILLDDKGNAVLIDFGISKNYDAAGQETTTTPVGMSDGYAPIEQYQQNVEEFSPVSDVYALGATLYFLLHGKRPISVVQRVSGEPLCINEQLSFEVKEILNSSMKVSKKERANSVHVFFKEISFSENRTMASDKSISENEDTYIEGAGTNNKYIQNGVSNNDKPAPTGSSNIVLYLLLGVFGIVVLFVLLGVWSSNNVRKSAEPIDGDTIVEVVDYYKPFVLKGKVGDNILFTMHLSVNNNIVEGTEHYANQKKDKIVNIKGTIDDNRIMTLNEYDGNVKTGSYRGLFSTDSYSGTFINKLGKEIAFSSVVMDEVDYSSKLKQKEQTIKDKFSSILNDYNNKYKNDDWWTSSYFLFDITKDGIPELWLLIKEPSDESADVSIHVYSYDNGLIYKGVYGHPSHHYLCQGNGYIINVFAHQGYCSWDKYEFIGGGIREKEIYSESLIGDEGYKVPSEEEVTTYNLTNKQPIANLQIIE